MVLTYWGRVTHLCVSKIVSLGSGYGISPGRCQAIFWTNVFCMVNWTVWEKRSGNFQSKSTHIYLSNVHLKLSSAKWWPCCLVLNLWTNRGWVTHMCEKTGYCSVQQWLVICWVTNRYHYNDVIMDTMASQITSLATVYSTAYLGADQRKHQSSASLALGRGIHRGPVNSSHKGPVTRKMFPFDDVIMVYKSWLIWLTNNLLHIFSGIWIYLQEIQNDEIWKRRMQIKSQVNKFYRKMKLH